MEILIGVISGIIVSFVGSYVSDLWNKLFKEKIAMKLKLGGVTVEFKLNDIEKSLSDVNDALSIQRENPKVFISHSSVDKEFARRLKHDLMEAGIDIWFDEDEIRIGDSISGKIKEGIDKSQWFIQILSPDSIKSAWAKIEYEKIIELEKSRNRKLIIPVTTTNIELPDQIKDRQYLNLGDDYEKNIQSLIDTIKFRNKDHSNKAISADAKSRAAE